MHFQVDKKTKHKAQVPHELFVSNVLIFHLMVIVTCLNINQFQLAVILPPLLTLACIALSLYQFNHHKQLGNHFIAAHWQLALFRYRLLLIAYTITLIILGIAWLLTHGENQASTADILFTALSRVAILPTLLSLMVLALFEAGALYLASKGELPKGFAEKHVTY